MARYPVVFIIAFFALLTAAPAFAAEDDAGAPPPDTGLGAVAPDVIGTILEVDGTATVTAAGHAGGQPATVQMPVHLHDIVETAAESRVFIQFVDNTQMTLSENTQVSIDDYVFHPDDAAHNKSFYSFLQGAFQYVSGQIGENAHIETPVGSIGIRGTDFWAGTLDGQYSVAVNDGQVGLKTDAGEEVVNKGEGTSVKDRHSIPSHAQKWGPEKFRRISSTVHLKHDKKYRLNQQRAAHRNNKQGQRAQEEKNQHPSRRQNKQRAGNGGRQNHRLNQRRGANRNNERQQRAQGQGRQRQGRGQRQGQHQGQRQQQRRAGQRRRQKNDGKNN